MFSQIGVNASFCTYLELVRNWVSDFEIDRNYPNYQAERMKVNILIWRKSVLTRLYLHFLFHLLEQVVVKLSRFFWMK